MEMTVLFRPRTAIEYVASAFCEVSGRAERLELVLKGQGAGPKARFSYEMLDLGDVYIDAVHHYEVCCFS